NRTRVLAGHHQQIVRPHRPMQATILDQARFEMDESLPGLDFKCCRSAISAQRPWIDILLPIQLRPDYQRSRSRWVTYAYRTLKVILVDVRHFPEESQSVSPTLSEKLKAIINFSFQSTTSGPTFRLYRLPNS